MVSFSSAAEIEVQAYTTRPEVLVGDEIWHYYKRAAQIKIHYGSYQGAVSKQRRKRNETRKK